MNHGDFKPCILCGHLTSGAVGASGYKWTIICQPCKDREDRILSEMVRHQKSTIDLFLGELYREFQNIEGARLVC